MIQVFDREQYFEDVAKIESEYLDRWFEDFEYKCFSGGSDAAFVDYGYGPF